jgi:serine protease Do
MLVMTHSVFSEERIDQFEKEIKKIKNQVSPSLVKVISENHKKYVATGIAIASDMILTSTLITRHTYDRIYIETISGQHHNARILGEDRRYSLILLKLDKQVMKPIRTTSRLDIGDWIALVGVFYNRFPSIIQGIVSSVSDQEMILNAPVFPGVSGGAVVNKRGELVAIIRGRFGIAVEPDISIVDHEGELILRTPKMTNKSLCYAVPVEKVLEIARTLEKHGKVKRGWLGVSIQSINNGGTVRIKTIFEQSPAQIAGLRKNDVVVSIDGNRIRETSDVSRIIRGLSPGKEVKIQVLRNEKPKSIRVKIGESRPAKKHYQAGDFRIRVSESPLVISEMQGRFPQAKNFVLYRRGSKKLGVDVMEITSELARRFKVKEGYGLMISKVYPKSAAFKTGLIEGDIIVSANQKPIRTLLDIQNRLTELEKGEVIRIEIYRDGKFRTFSIIPDMVKDEYENWRDFLSKSDFFSRYLYNSYSIGFKNVLKRQLGLLKTKINRLNKGGERISKAEFKKIENDINLLKKKFEETYNRELKRIQILRRHISEESKLFRNEGAIILKELEQIREKLKGKEN